MKMKSEHTKTLCNAAKEGWGKFKVLNAYIKKYEISQINKLPLKKKKNSKEEQTNPKASRM